MSDVVVVMRYFPFPPRTGSTVIASHTLPRLAARHRLHLVCAEQPERPGDGAEVFASIQCLTGPRYHPVWTRLRVAVHAAAGIPNVVSRNTAPHVREMVEEVAARTNAAALLVFEVMAVQWCPERLWPRTVANVEDPPSLKLERMTRITGSSARRAHMFVDAWAFGRYERDVLARLGRVLLLSEADVADLRARRKLANLRQVSYGVTAHESLPREARAPGRILLSGNMFHPPNVDGSVWFLRRIFPRILKVAPDASLAIVGDRPSPRIVHAARRFGARVTITGRVPDMAEHLRSAMVSVCPIRLKIGVQTKVLEALAWGTPVVTTSAGNSGVAGIDGRQLFVADEPERFAARVVELLDGGSWPLLSAEGRRLVEERFSWARSVAELEGYLDEVIRPTPAR
jgi:hypothetical protein